MKGRWFYKTTHKIPVKCYVPLGLIDNTHYHITYVQGGIDTDAGKVFINYNYCRFRNPFFWEMHFHEFLHRLFWLLKWERGHVIIDFFARIIHLPTIIRNVRRDNLYKGRR